MAPINKSGRVVLHARVSAPVGRFIEHAEDDGGGQAGGHAAGGKRRPNRRREVVTGTVEEGFENDRWRVKWDGPNYLQDSNGLMVTVEYYNALTVVPQGTGTGPASPTARAQM